MIAIAKIQERFTTEMALVILICRVSFQKQTTDSIVDFISKNRVDWNLFYTICEAHKIIPLTFGFLSKVGSAPPHCLAKFRAQSFSVATDNLKKVEELVRLHELFKSHNIPNIPYKGIILSKHLFNDFISRETSDIDFLIDKKYFAQVHTLLIADGYKPRFYNPDFEKQFLSSSHELLYRKNSANGATKIEIHWAATSSMMNIPVPTDLFFMDAQTTQILNKEVSILTLQNHLLILLIHHGVNDIWRSLRHCIDIAMFLNKFSETIDWDIFRTTLIKYKLLHTTTIGFYLASLLFGTEIPHHFKSDEIPPDFILNNLLNYPALQKPKLNFDNLQQQLYLRDSFRDRSALLLKYVNAGITPNVRDWESIRLSKHLYPLYYLLKPYRILFKKIKPTQP